MHRIRSLKRMRCVHRSTQPPRGDLLRPEPWPRRADPQDPRWPACGFVWKERAALFWESWILPRQVPVIAPHPPLTMLGHTPQCRGENFLSSSGVLRLDEHILVGDYFDLST